MLAPRGSSDTKRIAAEYIIITMRRMLLEGYPAIHAECMALLEDLVSGDKHPYPELANIQDLRLNYEIN